MKETPSTDPIAADKDRTITPAYVWFDTEFTGLDTADARLLQVAMVVTDTRLRRLAPPSEDVCLCVRLDPAAPVSDWVRQNLADLVRRCRSLDAVDVAEVDRLLSQRVDAAAGPANRDAKRRPILAGNTVHMDAAMARRFLPEFCKRLHYRILDVSTLKTFWNDSFNGPVFDKEDASMIRRFLPEGFAMPTSGEHDAYYDVHATLAEMNYYRMNLGVLQVTNPPVSTDNRMPRT